MENIKKNSFCQIIVLKSNLKNINLNQNAKIKSQNEIGPIGPMGPIGPIGLI